MGIAVNEESDISIEFTRGPTATICTLTVFNDRNDARQFVGESKKHPKDEYEEDIGDLYAVSRAFRAVADETERVADAMVVVAQDKLETILDFIAEMVERLADTEEVGCLCGQDHTENEAVDYGE